ncbi:MAG: MFS transporter [Planctomycetes bacterium]|nr:MFS transporter [Planctomycetota bacterium]
MLIQVMKNLIFVKNKYDGCQYRMMDTIDQNTSSRYRWIILFLVFLMTMNNYANRIVLGVTSNEIRDALSLDKIQYGYVVTAFSIAYTIGFLFIGKIIDRLGTKLGYLLSLICWSLVGACTGTSVGVYSLGAWQSMLGITESGNFPAAIKAVAEWFEPRQRALATALFNSGPHIALVLGPPAIALLTLSVGWRWTFGIIGLIGLPLAVLWQYFYKTPNDVKPFSNSGDVNSKVTAVRWGDIIKQKNTWGIMVGKFCTDPVWWFYIFWLPSFLNDRYGFNIKQIGWAMPVIYGLAILLANMAGWYAGHLIGKGWSNFKARKWVMLICAAFLPITVLSAFTPYPWVVILLVALAAGAHSGWSANIFTLVSDCFPTCSVASVTGLAGFAGGVGGIILSSLAPGFIITYFGYVPIFIMMACLHPLAFIVIHLTIKKQEMEQSENTLIV